MFLHGAGDIVHEETEAVYGQQDIHQKIMQYNFRDCHAKIQQVKLFKQLFDISYHLLKQYLFYQVDSHATLEHGQGVVVQVSGELSNNGEPMRLFVQTFILAPLSPKKYYVLTNIFRYLDEVCDKKEAESIVAEDTIRDVGGERMEEGMVEEPKFTEAWWRNLRLLKPPYFKVCNI